MAWSAAVETFPNSTAARQAGRIFLWIKKAGRDRRLVFRDLKNLFLSTSSLRMRLSKNSTMSFSLVLKNEFL